VRFGPLVDCDVHQELRDPDADLFPYLSSGWQEFVQSRPGGVTTVPSAAMYAENPFGYNRKDAYPPEGGPPGSSPGYMIEQLLDPYDVEAAILTGGDGGLAVSGLNNPYFAAEVSRALNDHLTEHWLAVDRRFKGSAMLALQVPEWAEKEIRRCAELHPQFVQAVSVTNPLCYGFGHPIFDPVHRACAETGLPFGIHSLGEGYAGAVPSHLASGWPTLYVEFHTGGIQGILTHLMSFVFHGVFERYPTFRLVLIEAGVSWLPGFLRRMDANFKGLRRETPWLKKLPSEYVMEHVVVTTQPFDIDSPDDELIAALDAAGAADILAYSSDYPHWDTDVPTRAVAAMPPHWREKVLRGNASRLYGLELPVAA
jgi:predicted TIM-barrel fold metal-dependent hydrolase